MARGADGLFGGQAQRCYDFRKGERLGEKDHIVEWVRPARPEWIDELTYAHYPEKLRVRELKVNNRVYVTTFLNSSKCPRKELAKIYEMRWQVKINVRSIKSVMNMEMLSCKTAEMVRKEIGIHFLAYNFIRIIMAQACCRHGRSPNKISFKCSVQLINQFMLHFLSGSKSKNEIMFEKMLTLIVKNKIGHRPGRVEPRAVKPRRKPFPLLQKSRAIEQAKLKKRREKLIAKIGCY